MSIELNHTIVLARDKAASAAFLAELLGLDVGAEWGPFLPVKLANRVELDYMDADEVQPHHYAFLVTDAEFDAILERIRANDVEFFAEPDLSGRGEINHSYGGRGVYFLGPDAHLYEAITHPYV